MWRTVEDQAIEWLPLTAHQPKPAARFMTPTSMDAPGERVQIYSAEEKQHSRRRLNGRKKGSVAEFGMQIGITGSRDAIESKCQTHRYHVRAASLNIAAARRETNTKGKAKK